MKSSRRLFVACSLVAFSTAVGYTLFAHAQAPVAPPAQKQPATPYKAVPAEQPNPEIEDKPAPDKKDPNLKRLSPNYDLWIDMKNKKVVMEGTVCLVRGQLEMFACTRRTKEHESILTVLTTAQAAHAALLAIGAKQGKPVQFDPVYKPASGSEIEIALSWVDKDGKQKTARAQDWVQDANTKKAMVHPWVFPGSGFYVDDTTGKRQYLADSGDFICVSNFSSAMLDLPIKSTDQKDEGILFEAFTDKIPPKGTKVTMTLSVVPPKDGEAKPAEKATEKATEKSVEKTAPAK